jgi:hypothetical protein
MADALSEQERRGVCIHEAAHAVVHAVGGGVVFGVKVAPAGATDWHAWSINGKSLSDLWGCCSTAAAPIGEFIRWDSDTLSYAADRKGYAARLQLIERHQRGSGAAQRRELRAFICGVLAGPIADEIRAGALPGIELFQESEEGTDEAIAEAMAWLLPFRNEHDHLIAETESALREAGTWQAVMRLANALEVEGCIEGSDLDAYLPRPRRAWPPSPRGASKLRKG